MGGSKSNKAQGKRSQALRDGLDVQHAQIRLTKSTSSVSSPESSQMKPRKPYTIKQPLTSGKVRAMDTHRPNVNEIFTHYVGAIIRFKKC
jgi:hypothetical protein